MEPEIRANDTVIYRITESITDAGLYILDLDGARIVKLVHRLAGGALELIPANPTYQRERLLPLNDADTENTFRSDLTGLISVIHVVGKVVFYARPA